MRRTLLLLVLTLAAACYAVWHGPGISNDALAVALLAYVVAMALPFFPGIEIGLAMMVALGSKVVPLVYVATVLALLLAFGIGRLVPAAATLRAFELLRWHRARQLLADIQGLEEKQRLAFLLGRAPPRLVRYLLEHRYLAIAIALNTPGNVMLGDGGGLSLAAGVSGLYSFPRFALTVALAVLPVPLALMLALP